MGKLVGMLNRALACYALTPPEHEELRRAVTDYEQRQEAALERSIPEPAGSFDLVAHLRRQRAFSLRTFGPGARSAGVIDHLRKELLELERDPSDLTEWIDVVLLACDGAWRQGFTPEQIACNLGEKLARNEQRSWPDWRTADPNKAIEHVRTEEQPIAPPPAVVEAKPAAAVERAESAPRPLSALEQEIAYLRAYNVHARTDGAVLAAHAAGLLVDALGSSPTVEELCDALRKLRKERADEIHGLEAQIENLALERREAVNMNDRHRRALAAYQASAAPRQQVKLAAELRNAEAALGRLREHLEALAEHLRGSIVTAEAGRVIDGVEP